VLEYLRKDTAEKRRGSLSLSLVEVECLIRCEDALRCEDKNPRLWSRVWSDLVRCAHHGTRRVAVEHVHTSSRREPREEQEHASATVKSIVRSPQLSTAISMRRARVVTQRRSTMADDAPTRRFFPVSSFRPAPEKPNGRTVRSRLNPLLSSRRDPLPFLPARPSPREYSAPGGEARSLELVLANLARIHRVKSKYNILFYN